MLTTQRSKEEDNQPDFAQQTNNSNIVCFVAGCLVVGAFWIGHSIWGCFQSKTVNSDVQPSASPAHDNNAFFLGEQLIRVSTTGVEKEGTSAIVFQGKMGELDVALKKFKVGKESNFQRELDNNRRLAERDPPSALFVKFHGENTTQKFLVFDFMQEGSLGDYLRNLSAPLSLKSVLELGKDIISGIAFLHRHGLMHRDIKPDNIMLCNHRTRAKIADLGESRFLQPDERAITFTGTICYMAPEVNADRSYTKSADIYSFGCLLYEMITRKIPRINDIYGQIDSGLLGHPLNQFLKDCCALNEKDRPCAECCQKLIEALLAEVDKKRKRDAEDHPDEEDLRPFKRR